MLNEAILKYENHFFTVVPTHRNETNINEQYHYVLSQMRKSSNIVINATIIYQFHFPIKLSIENVQMFQKSICEIFFKPQLRKQLDVL